MYESTTLSGRRSIHPGRLSLGALLLLALAAPSPLAAQGEGEPERMVTGVRFRGNHALAADTLAISIVTSNSSFFATFFLTRPLHFGRRRIFDEVEFRRDVVRLQLLYRQHGYFEARVDTTVRRSERTVKVTFRIQEGPPVVVDSIAVTGVDSIAAPVRLARALPLAVGRPFDRFLFAAAADTLAAILSNRGYPFVEVYRSYTVDNTTRLARVGFDVVPGPHARVGALVIDSASSVSRRTIRRSLAVREGDAFNQDALYDSQRSLYQTDLFRFVSVGIAPESTVAGTDSLVRVLVQVRDGPHTRFRTGVGYGTIDCFRAQATLGVNNFLGGARQLELAGKVSKVGFGHPMALASRDVWCPGLAEDSRFSDTLNYVASIAFTQPSLFARRNAITLSAFAERRSEFKAFERIGVGGSVAYAFGVGRDLPVTLTYRLAYGRTRADDATFCVFFDRCEQSAIGQLTASRRQATLGLGVVQARTDNPVDPTRGHVNSFDAYYAGSAIGSQYAFAKLVGEAAAYWRLSRGWVLAVRARAGIVWPGVSTVAGGVKFVPPEERFFAGGPTTVRGFGRNEMGPVVYLADSLDPGAPIGLRTSPLGSNAVTLANLEVRFPSPFLPSRLRLAAFLDVGQLWEQRTRGLLPSGVRATPGLGLRVATPLGPMRLDAAYNGYDRQPGPLYVVNRAGGTLDLVDPDYPGPPRRTSFVSRLQLHFSVGQAF